MTFSEIVSATAERLNLTSPEALARIGRYVNDRNRQVTSSVGLNTSRRTTNSQNTVIGSQVLTFALEKLETVYTLVSGKRRVLTEMSYDDWRRADTAHPGTGDSDRYAIETTGASTVVIVLDYTPDAIEAIKADGLAPATVLATTGVPPFPADFHDALIFGALADEYDKLEKPKQADKYERKYEDRVSDLRYFLAKSIYLKQHQGERSSGIITPPEDRRIL
jgi:hypothetical protein